MSQLFTLSPSLPLLNHPWSNVYLCALSGGIAVGKSTLLKMAEDRLRSKLAAQGYVLVVVQEPVDVWRQKGWLQTFYADPKNNALAFQILVYKTHVRVVQEALLKYKDTPDIKVVCLVERSMWDQLLFWKLQVDLGREKGGMDDTAYMEDWSLWMQCLPPVKRIFYCRMSTLEETLKRVWLRARPEEGGGDAKDTDILYHDALREKHELWYAGKTFMDSIPVTIVDMNAPFHTDAQVLNNIIDMMANCIFF
jgi:deoxyadenosine/deoxycytidine kinase